MWFFLMHNQFNKKNYHKKQFFFFVCGYKKNKSCIATPHSKPTNLINIVFGGADEQ